MTSDEVHESLEDNTSYLFSNDNQLLHHSNKSLEEILLLTVSPPATKMSSFSSKAFPYIQAGVKFWIPPPVKSPEERGCERYTF